MKLSYREMGKGKPLIILHGLFGSSDNWLSIARELENEYKIYLLDQRNHGDSPHSEEFTYTAMAADIKEFVEEHAIEAPVVIGHSMGGKTAMNFAVAYPELLEKLVVVDIAPRHYPVHHDVILEGLEAVDAANVQSRREADEVLSEYVPELGVRQFLLKNLARKSAGGYQWKINLPVISDQIEQVGEALSEDARFEKPTLFINGAKSGYIKESDQPLIRRIFPQAKVETIQGAGHWVHAEKPGELIEVMRTFIEA